jgi:hypothetical protein
MSNKKQFSLSELVSFGQYLLSEQRQKFVSTLLEKDVTHADICNWSDDKLIDEEIAQPGIKDIYETALNNICNPLEYLKSNLKDGETLNGMMTILILDKGEFYKNIAKEALDNASKILNDNEIPEIPNELQNTNWMKGKV